MKLYKKLLVVLLVIIAPVSLEANQPYDIKINLLPGTIIQQRQSIVQSTVQHLMDMKQRTNMKMLTDYTIEVLSIDSNQNYIIKQTIDSVQVEHSMPNGMMFVYDSNKPQQQSTPSSVGYEMLVGLEFTLILSPMGVLEKMSGFDQMIERMIASRSEIGEQEKEEYKKFIKTIMGEEQINNIFNEFYSLYPGQSVKVSDSWESKKEINHSLMSSVTHSLSTLASVDDVSFFVNVNTDYEPSDQAQEIDLGQMRMRQILTSGLQTNQVSLAKDTGWVTYSEINQELTGELQMKMDHSQEDSEVVIIPFESKTEMIVESL